MNATDPALNLSNAPAIAQDLRQRILAGDLRAGQRLTEMELVERYQVGRGRIREAFRMLVGEGYLEFVTNKGVLVRRYSREEVLATGRAREVLEGLAARLAAERALSADQRRALEETQAQLDAAEAAQDVDGFNDINRAYHALIEDLGGNAHVAEFISRVRLPLLRLQLPRSFAVDSIERSNRDHRAITMAILSGAPEAAEAAMRAHVRAGNDHISALSDEAFT